MSDTDSDSESVSFDTPLKFAISCALDMAPETVSYQNLRRKLVNDLGSNSKPLHRSPLKNTHNTRGSVKDKDSRPSSDRHAILENFDDISGDIHRVHSKLDLLVSSLLDIITKVEKLENRVLALEKKIENLPETPVSYADAVAKNSEISKNSSARLSKLEYISSEEERKRRLLQVTVKHPLLNCVALDH